MVRLLAGVGALVALSTLPGLAQRPGGAGVVSPEVLTDRRVTFRLFAPNAKLVTVSGEWSSGAREMTRDENGLWSVTLGPVPADLYGYSFSVDGFQTLDPANSQVKPMRSPRTSILDVPGSVPALHDFQETPHGVVRTHAYASRSLGRRRGLVVYTPPNYDSAGKARYPVLYLLHGAGDNEATWTALGRAHWILDNLIAAGKARPMIVVMTDGHAAPPEGALRTPEGRARGMDAYRRDLLEDVIPFVERTYRVRADAASRAIAGLSMGGGQALSIGLSHPERFAWVGGFSSAVFEPERTLATAFADPKGRNARLRLLWTACGKADFLIENARGFHALLEKHQIRHQFLETEGNHSWPVWRRYLVQFAPLLFGERSSEAARAN